MPKPDYTALDLPPPPANRPYVLVNMVMSVDGKVVVEGTEQGIGSKVDQRLMRELRVNADMVFNGASTFRASGSSPRIGDEALEQLRLDRGKPRSPLGATISRSGELPTDKIFFTATDFETIVYLSETVPPDRLAAIRETGRRVRLLPPGHEIEHMLRDTRAELGVEVLLVEGGPTVNAELFRLDAVDEYFTTVGPVVVGGRDTLTAVEGPMAFTRADLRHMALVSAVANEATDEVYLRYRRKR